MATCVVAALLKAEDEIGEIERCVEGEIRQRLTNVVKAPVGRSELAL